MSDNLEQVVRDICAAHDDDRIRMMDIVREVQARMGCVSSQAAELIAAAVGAHRVEVESVVSFYAFLSSRPKGKTVIRLCDDIVDRFQGADAIGEVLGDALGIDFGQTTADGKITLEHTPCIGMCDQSPAALVNDVVVTNLTPDKARAMAAELLAGAEPQALVKDLGDGVNADERVRSMVVNNVRKAGPVLGDLKPGDALGEALGKALAMSGDEVIAQVKTSRLRGRGGAGFPTGMKWGFTRDAAGEQKYVLCNADEGEPGTFKDRVLLTEKANLLFEGMTIAGYAVGSDTGVMYLRGEYAYLRAMLESTLDARRKQGLLGKDILGQGFDFDIRIQMGAGAYICGEESALISSCEGLRGDPKTRPPFPAQKGFLASPTTVNNVETFCCVTRIFEHDPEWFAKIGTPDSSGTKLLSVSGDCAKAGIFEVPFGTKLSDLLTMAEAQDTGAVVVGGPSGQFVAPAEFGRAICFGDLATGGSIMVFNQQRNVLEIAAAFLEFFVEESCGFCTPCRAGNVLLLQGLKKILTGKGEPSDLAYLQNLGTTVKMTSRCGLGQTSANPVLTTLANFRSAYEALVKDAGDGLQPTFDLGAALAPAEKAQGRASVHAEA